MEVRVRRGEGALQHIIEIGPHKLLTDEPRMYGGEDTGPSAHDLLAASLAACTAATIAMYAKRKGMDLRDIDVRIEHDSKEGTYVLTRRIQYIGNLSDQEKQRLTEIANKCPVHKILTGPIRIETEAGDHER